MLVYAQSVGLHRLSAVVRLLMGTFFLLLSLGAMGFSAYAMWSGRAEWASALPFLLGLLFASLTASEVFTGFRAALLPSQTLSGLLQHANEVKHETSRASWMAMHFVLGEREFVIPSRGLTHGRLLVPGRQVTVTFTRDGEVMNLVADEHQRVAVQALPPSGVVRVLSDEDLRAGRRVLNRRALGEGLTALVAFVGAGLSFGQWLMVVLSLIVGAIFASFARRSLANAKSLSSLTPGTPADVVEGAWRRKRSFPAERSVGEQQVTLATLTSPHGLARKVRARGVRVPGQNEFLVLEWLASTD